MKDFLNEFKKFAVKGNALDMAIGIMLGTAFNNIVQSLVNDIVMPPLGLIIGGIKFTDFKWDLKPAMYNEVGVKLSDSVSLTYGNFIQIIFNFVIIAFSLFMAIKTINVIKERTERKEKKEEKVAQEEQQQKPRPIEDRQLSVLCEIRDLLVKQNGGAGVKSKLN